MSTSGLSVVALGGGHGLAATLRALSTIDLHATAIVTVADDGGSSGQLRKDYGILPPGDLRMALAALCAPDTQGQQNSELFQHRFSGAGALSGHPVGNVILAALWELEDDKVAALARAGALLGARGRVLPMSTIPLNIQANIEELDGRKHRISGQVNVATAHGKILDVAVVPDDPPACPQALAAIAEADWIILGPGSWYTSIMPALIIPQLRDAIIESSAQKLLVLNLVDQPGETEGLGPVEHLAVFQQHAKNVTINAILVDASHEDQSADIGAIASELGARVILADVQSRQDPGLHDSARLSRVLSEILARVP